MNYVLQIFCCVSKERQNTPNHELSSRNAGADQEDGKQQ
jgi:hypothetical protein